MLAAIKRVVAQNLVGSRFYAPVRHVYRRFSRHRTVGIANEAAFYSQFVKPGDLVFDIGANAGYKTEIFLACGAKVISVEPNPLCQRVLRFEFASNPRVHLVQAAVGAEEGMLPMNVRGLSPMSSLLDDWEPFKVEGGGQQRINVPVTTLDKLIERFGRPSFIKIDVEGFEEQVLNGLSSPVPFLSFEYGLRGECLARFKACLARLQKISSITINAIEDDSSTRVRKLRFVLDEPRQPDDLTDFPPGGDCFVASKMT